MSASELKVTALGRGEFLIDNGNAQRFAYGVAGADGQWVFLDGRVYHIASTRERTRSRHVADEAALTSAMPATVLLVNVEPGTHVARGDLLILLEAMKMEVPIKAPRDARVVRVNCRKGELVQPGVPLVDLEDAPPAEPTTT